MEQLIQNAMDEDNARSIEGDNDGDQNEGDSGPVANDGDHNEDEEGMTMDDATTDDFGDSETETESE